MKSQSIAALASLSLLGAAPPAPHVDMGRMSDVTRMLASDAFQGRAPGTPGEDRTIPYLIEQFKAAGLEPAGENGGWTQEVPLIHTQLKAPVGVSVAQGGQTLRLNFPDDIYLGTTRPVDRVAIVNAPMVFVGYGVTAPERGWDDFKGVDLKGKVAVMLVNDPDFEAGPGEPVAGKFGGKTMTFYGRWVYKYEEAARRDRRAGGARDRRRGLSMDGGQEPGGRKLQRRAAGGRAAAGIAAGLGPAIGRRRPAEARRL